MMHLALFLSVFALATHVSAALYFALEPPDTSSPRATVESFLRYSDVYISANSDQSVSAGKAEAAMARAIRLFDLSEFAPVIANDSGREAVLLLVEILGRIPLPDLVVIPDKEAVQSYEVTRWHIPLTEITVEKIGEGPRSGEFLFTHETIGQLHQFYTDIRKLPLREGAATGLYDRFVQEAGWMIPDRLISRLPHFFKEIHAGNPLWKWLGLIILSIMGLFFLWRIHSGYGIWKNKQGLQSWPLKTLVFPLSAMAVCILVEYLIRSQLILTGTLLIVAVVIVRGLLLVYSSWMILVCSNIAVYNIITSRRLSDEALDSDLIRLAFRLLGFTLVFVLLYYGGLDFGLPVKAAFASAGVVGVALALAARETLANFFGGISLLTDRPFQSGDFIVLDSGERGEVQSIGLRSTRLQTRDDILITIPNSVITNVKIVNQSRPSRHFRVRVGVNVAYGSDLELVEAILVKVARSNALVMENPEPLALLRSFGDSSIHFELLAWVIRPSDHGQLVHELSKAIHKRFKEEGVIIPFPQRDIHLSQIQEE